MHGSSLRRVPGLVGLALMLTVCGAPVLAQQDAVALVLEVKGLVRGPARQVVRHAFVVQLRSPVDDPLRGPGRVGREGHQRN